MVCCVFGVFVCGLLGIAFEFDKSFHDVIEDLLLWLIRNRILQQFEIIDRLNMNVSKLGVNSTRFLVEKFLVFEGQLFIVLYLL